MSKFEFTPGEYVTRDGRRAVVLCTDAPGSWPLVGYITALGINSAPASWRADGSTDGACRFHDTDLMPPVPAPEPEVVWIGLHDDRNGDTFHTVGPFMPPKSEGLIATARVILTPGQFDDEYSYSWEYERGRNDGIEAAHEAVRLFWPSCSNSTGAAPVMREIRSLKRGNGHA